MIHKIKNNFNKILNNYFTIILGFFMFALFIYLRFIRERLPRDIPFKFLVLGFFIIIQLCLIYLYIVFRLIKPAKKSNEIVTIIVDFLYKPLEDFDYFWKHHPFINTRYNKFMYWFSLKLYHILYEKYIFIIIFMIVPRVILISTFMIDIFYFSQLKYIYKVLFIGILLFLRRYIIYSIKKFKEDLYIEVDLWVDQITTNYSYGIHPSEWPENIDPDDEDDDEYPPTMCLDLKLYIEVYVKYKIYQDKIFELIFIYPKTSVFKKFMEKYNLLEFTAPFPNIVQCELNFEREAITSKIKSILYLETLIEYYYISYNNIKIRNILIIIYSLYAFCWLYILYISKNSLSITDLNLALELTYLKVEEPFSDLIINEI